MEVLALGYLCHRPQVYNHEPDCVFSGKVLSWCSHVCQWDFGPSLLPCRCYAQQARDKVHLPQGRVLFKLIRSDTKRLEMLHLLVALAGVQLL